MSMSLHDYLTNNSNILVTDVTCTWPLESRGVSITSITETNVTFTCCKYQKPYCIAFYIIYLLTDAPMILNHPQNNTSALTGQSVIISCNISALPRPEVTWLRDNDTVEYDHRVELLEDGSLYISNVMLIDDGLYQCVATNVNGSAESDFGMLSVSGKLITSNMDKMEMI